MLAGLVATLLVVAAGGVAGVAHLMKPYDGLVDRPLTQPTLPHSDNSPSSAPEATVTKAVAISGPFGSTMATRSPRPTPTRLSAATVRSISARNAA